MAYYILLKTKNDSEMSIFLF